MSYPDPNSSFYDKELKNVKNTAGTIEKIEDPKQRKWYAMKYATATYSEALYWTALMDNPLAEHEDNIETTIEIIKKSTSKDVLYSAASRKNEKILFEILEKELNTDVIEEILKNETTTVEMVEKMLKKSLHNKPRNWNTIMNSIKNNKKFREVYEKNQI